MVDKTTTVKDFRYDINALRAIAVLGVMFFHYKVNYFFGGFAGVDIFFVISGYLMTRIVMTGIEKNKFSFAEFYGRRLSRIIPALLFLVFVVTAVCFFIYFPNDYMVLQKNAASSVLFISNIVYWRNISYFAPASNDNVFLHTWSLSVEWQFYLLYPVLLIGLYKVCKQKKQQLIVFIITTLVLFAASVWWNTVDASSAFYLLPTRAWEMLTGGVAFLAADYVKNFKGRPIMAIIGYALIAFCFYYLKSWMPWPGMYTLLPVLATFMIIIANYDFRLLRFSGIQFVGKISYSTYLWHWPIYVIVQYMDIQIKLISVVLSLVALLLGYISYKLVETRKYSSNARILVVASVLLIATGSMAFIDANHIVFKDSTVKIASYKDILLEGKSKQKSKRSRCWISSAGNDFDEKECLYLDSQKRNILLLGDSHGLQFSELLRAEMEKRNINLLQATASGCFAIARPNGGKECRDLMEFVYKDFIKHNSAKIDGVIICGFWGKPGIDRTLTLTDLQNTLAYLNKTNVKAVIIGENETYKMNYPYISARENEYNLKLSKKYQNISSFKTNEFLKANLKDNYIDIYTYGEVPKPVDNMPYMIDRNHLSKLGAGIAMKKILASKRFISMLE